MKNLVATKPVAAVNAMRLTKCHVLWIQGFGGRSRGWCHASSPSMNCEEMGFQQMSESNYYRHDVTCPPTPPPALRRKLCTTHHKHLSSLSS